MDMPIVKKILDDYWDRRLPVNVDMIAAQMGMKVIATGPFDPNPRNRSLSGYAEIQNGQPVVAFNPTEAPYRGRFTIAHEMGHHALGHTQGGICCRDSEAQISDHKEKAANQFAAELLMPQEAINYYVMNLGISNVLQLSNIFNVSESAMYYRLKNLNMVS